MEQPEFSEANTKKDTPAKRFKRTTMEDAERWLRKYKQRNSILKIAREEGIDPGTVSKWLKKLGVEVGQGAHFVSQPHLAYSDDALRTLREGPEAVVKLLKERVWGISFGKKGLLQLQKFSNFVALYDQKCGVEEIAEKTRVHRSTIAQWRSGSDQPYLVKTLEVMLNMNPPKETLVLPLRLDSGGNVQSKWIMVPRAIRDYDDLVGVVSQLSSLPDADENARQFGILPDELRMMRMDLVGYLLGVMLGDAGKVGGNQLRMSSMNIDLQLSKKRESNERLGDFVCLCASLLGIKMRRIADKQPSGSSRYGMQPKAAYRWSSERSPLLSWLFTACLGLENGQTTTWHQVNMEWIFGAPFGFRKRFIQGVTDSDGSVKKYVVEITSVPNADFIRKLLLSLGLQSAYVRVEKGIRLRTVVRAREAATIPIANEFTGGYRYEQLMRYLRPHLGREAVPRP